MAYQAIDPRKRDSLGSSSPSEPSLADHEPESHDFALLSTSDHEEDAHRHTEDNTVIHSSNEGVENLIRSMLASNSSYDMVEDDDYEAHDTAVAPNQSRSRSTTKSQNEASTKTSSSFRRYGSMLQSPTESIQQDASTMRTVSRTGSMRHPVPDLQSLQGAYLTNIERLEESAEKISESSDIGEEVRKIRNEQKRSESRKSSVTGLGDGHSTTGRQYSGYSSSILATNSVARSGGFSPGGFIASPIESLRSPSGSHRSLWGRHSLKGDHPLKQHSDPDNPTRRLGSPASLRSVPIIAAPKVPAHVTPHQRDDEHLPLTAEDEEDFSEFHVHPEELPADHEEVIEDEQVRPASAASDNTYRRATLFADFDGVHVTTHEEAKDLAESASLRQSIHENIHESILERQAALHDPPTIDKRKSQAPRADLLEEQGMVYYPAPVPMMLNLPQKLSKASAADRDRRRTQLMGAINSDARKSALNLNGQLHNARRSTNLQQWASELPPQLRATMFFEQQSVPHHVEMMGNSAVATLDSILDASAFAPVDAFTDHPVVGAAGADIYRRNDQNRRSAAWAKQRQSRSSLNLLKQRHSSAPFSHDSRNLQQHHERRDSSAPQPVNGDESSVYEGRTSSSYRPREDTGQHEDYDIDDINENSGFLDAEAEFDGEPGQDDPQEEFSAPTTLLAELQMRKLQLKQRNRTAATDFPGGMRSTLLQLDTVAQLESQARNNKQITLAWEDPNMRRSGLANQEDEDVPLGLLYQKERSRAKAIDPFHDDDIRPLGLIAKRQLEDNEPLSKRRARLRGEAVLRPPARQPAPDMRASTYTLDNIPNFPAPDAQDPEHEHETLGQRLKRLRNAKAADPSQYTSTLHHPQQPQQPQSNHHSRAPSRALSTDFASEVLSQVGIPAPTNVEIPSLTHPTSKTPRALEDEGEEEEEETLAQRRARLQAEKEATKPPMNKRHSMASILAAHPVKPDVEMKKPAVSNAKLAGLGNAAKEGLINSRHGLGPGGRGLSKEDGGRQERPQRVVVEKQERPRAAAKWASTSNLLSQSLSLAPAFQPSSMQQLNGQQRMSVAQHPQQAPPPPLMRTGTGTGAIIASPHNMAPPAAYTNPLAFSKAHVPVPVNGGWAGQVAAQAGVVAGGGGLQSQALLEGERRTREMIDRWRMSIR